MNMKWTFYEIWNKSLEKNKARPLIPRERIWASELGKAFIDRYLRMNAVPPTNPPNARSRRKFETGNIWEAIIGYVLTRAGILIKKGEWLKYQYPDLLPVTGKLDFVAGGRPDYEKATSLIQSEFNWLPEFISRATLGIVTKLREKYPDGLQQIILEIKSCSSSMFEKYETNDAALHHKLQNFHYLKASGMKEGHIVYVCKDDARLLEIGVFNPSGLEEQYFEDIREITQYIKTDTQPPLEKPISFDGKFFANWRIGYSGYLTYLYGFADQKEFDDKYKPLAGRWNRVLERIKEGKELTQNNLEAVKEMEREGFSFDKIRKEVSNG